MRNEAIESIGENGSGLRIEFVWDNDRYRHTISIVDPSGAITPLLRSIEGGTEDDFPPSPPLQTLNVETISDGQTVALLVGMAGRSHWSASVEPQSGEAAIVFDLACRYTPDRQYPQPPKQLGSRYFLISPLMNNQLSIASDDIIVLNAAQAF